MHKMIIERLHIHGNAIDAMLLYQAEMESPVLRLETN